MGKREFLIYGIGDSQIGPVLVASSIKGLRAIYIGGDAEALIAELKAEFPAYDCVEAVCEYDYVIARVLDCIENPSHTFELPLDSRGSDFEEIVWAALCTVEAGTIVNYADVALLIGADPGMARLVARACGRNNLALVIPCHRVVDANGMAPSFRWGEQIRRHLLDREMSLEQQG